MPQRNRDGRHCSGGERELHAAQAEDRAPDLPHARGVELEADQEQEQHHAELGEMQHGARLGDEAQSPGPDGDAGDEIAEHRARAEAREDRHRDDARAEVDERLLEKAVGVHG